MKRGDVVLASGRGDFSGKPRPALVVQSDSFNATHPSICLCPITTSALGQALFRIPVQPSSSNGVRELSEIQVDKVQAVRRKHISDVVGTLETAILDQVDEALRRWLDL